VTLYSTALDLPNVKPDPGYHPGGEWSKKNKGLTIEDQLRLNPHLQEHSRRHTAISDKVTRLLGREIPYQTVFDPLHDREAISFSVTGDLADIYCDVKEGVVAMAGSGPPVSKHCMGVEIWP
jgi:hypothetical protein